MIKQVLRALGIVFAVCIVIRVCWFLVEPLLAPLGVLVMFVGIGYLLLSGSRYRG